MVRDSDGALVAGACAKVADIVDPMAAEAWACKLACLIVEEFGLTPAKFETDCLSLVQALQVEGEDTSILGRIIDDVSFMLSTFHSSSIHHV